MPNQRARSASEKAARRRAIVDAAGAALDSSGFAGFTMENVAERVGLSKAALYRYFATRESLLLELAVDELRAFFDCVDEQLLSASRSVSDPTALCARWVCDAALARPRLIRMQGVTASILEPNIEVDTAVAFKSWLLERCATTGASLASYCGASGDAGVRFLVHFQLVIVGLDSHLHPSPAVAEALTRPGLEAFQLDVAAELEHVASALARATLQPTLDPSDDEQPARQTRQRATTGRNS